MSDLSNKHSRKSSGSSYDDLVREAREDLTPSIDDAAFEAMEERILARMSKEPTPLEADVASDMGSSGSRRSRLVGVGAVVLAAAAAFALFTNSHPTASGPVTAQADLNGGALRTAEGAGELRVGGVRAMAGQVLRAGDQLEVEGARAVLERPRKVTYLIERNADDPHDAPIAHATVKSAGESLVLALETGAIEAQVTPVPNGEAFAVDVSTPTNLVRVAVHGTHLRVTRSGSHVVVDLNEGVVSIGVPPRTGSTLGTLVTAPSHVEFDANDVAGTLHIDHSPSAVRAPIPLGPADGPSARVDAPPAAPEAPAAVAVATSAPDAPATVPRPLSVPRTAAGPAPIARPKIDAPAVPAREAIAAAVRECAALRKRPDNVRVSVLSSLKLKIGPDGSVDVAQFNPPLLPEIQSCAATAIYKAKLEDAASGTVTIPIDFTY